MSKSLSLLGILRQCISQELLSLAMRLEPDIEQRIVLGRLLITYWSVDSFNEILKDSKRIIGKKPSRVELKWQ